jgi:hypothetical protein
MGPMPHVAAAGLLFDQIVTKPVDPIVTAA